MAVTLLDTFNQFFDDAGDPLNGGFVYTFEPDGTTPKATYTDTDGNSAHDNPIELLSNGRPPSPIFWTAGAAYNAVLKDADGVTLDTILSFEVPDTTALNNTFATSILTVIGNPDAADQWLGGERWERAVDFPANWSGSVGKIPKVLPTAEYVVTIKKGGSTVGTATCDTSGAWTFATAAGAAISFAAADEMDYYGPTSPDVTMADFGLTLAGTLAE